MRLLYAFLTMLLCPTMRSLVSRRTIGRRLHKTPNIAYSLGLRPKNWNLNLRTARDGTAAVLVLFWGLVKLGSPSRNVTAEDINRVGGC